MYACMYMYDVCIYMYVCMYVCMYVYRREHYKDDTRLVLINAISNVIARNSRSLR